MSFTRIYIYILVLLFLGISETTAQTSNGSFDDGAGSNNGDRRGGLFKKRQDDGFGKEPFFSFLKRRKKENAPIGKGNSESGNVVSGVFFDGETLNDREKKKIEKQLKRYEKQKPTKWEKNHLEMIKRGYPVHPDTARKYRHLASRILRQKNTRIRRIKKFYKKEFYIRQGKRGSQSGASVKTELKEKDKKNEKRHKQRARRLKRKQRTGHYLPFYERWFKDGGMKKRRKKRT